MGNTLRFKESLHILLVSIQDFSRTINISVRFVKMRVAQWREDMLAWAGRRGYGETGGGVWGELDGESGEALTRPTRYIVLTASVSPGARGTVVG